MATRRRAIVGSKLLVAEGWTVIAARVFQRWRLVGRGAAIQHCRACAVAGTALAVRRWRAVAAASAALTFWRCS